MHFQVLRGKISTHLPKFIVVLSALVIIIRFSITVSHVQLGGDGSLRYVPLAINLLLGNGFSTSQTAPFVPDEYNVPGYPLFVAAVFGVTNNSLQAVVIAQVLLELSTLLMMIKIAGALNLPHSVKILALMIGLISPFLWIFATTALSEIVGTFIVTVNILLISKALQRQDKRNSLWWLLAGSTSGACLLVRTDLITCVTLLLMAGLMISLVEEAGWQRTTWHGIAFASGLILLLFPWMLRDYVVFREIRIPGLTQVTHVFESDHSSYYRWISTWADDPSLIDEYGFQVFLRPEEQRYFPPEKVALEMRKRAEVAWALARKNRSFVGVPSEEFARLTDMAIKLNPLSAQLIVPARRTGMMWVRVPSYLDLVDPPATLKIAAYGLWLLLLGCVPSGFIYGLLYQHNIRLVLLFFVIIGRSIPAFMNFVGSEPRFLVEALPACYLLAALGIFGLGSLIRAMRSTMFVTG